MAGFGNIFFMNIAQVASEAQKFGKQAAQTQQVQALVKAYGPKIQGAWIGGDADEFNADIIRKLMPKFTELALAFTGIQVNLTKSGDAATGGDKKAAGLASGFSDICSKIYP
jgi:WXG100 family type VII secretion target